MLKIAIDCEVPFNASDIEAPPPPDLRLNIQKLIRKHMFCHEVCY